MSKSSLVIVTKNLPPDIGGMEKLWFEAIRGLNSGFELVVIAPSQAKIYVSSYCTFFGIPRFFPLLFIVGIIRTFVATIQFQPKTILAGSGVTAPIVWLVSKLTDRRSACYLHGLDIIYPSWVYQKLFLPLIRRIDLILVNSRNTKKIAQHFGVEAEKISIINPGVSIPRGFNEIKEDFSHIDIDKDKKHLIFFGRIVRSGPVCLNT